MDGTNKDVLKEATPLICGVTDTNLRLCKGTETEMYQK